MYTPLFVHSYYSLLRGLNSPKEIIKHVKSLGMTACALTDINNLCGAIEFYKEAKANNIKPIIGSYILTNCGSLILIALNKSGYTELLKITAKLNSKKNYIGQKQILELKDLISFDLSNIICLSGHEDSTLYNAIIKHYKELDDWNILATNRLLDLRNAFGDDNCYIELQFSEYDSLSHNIKSKLIDLHNKAPHVKLVSIPRVYYLKKEDQDLQKILLAVDSKKSLKELNKINDPLYKFFDGYRFYMPSIEEFDKDSYQLGRQTSIDISNRIEDYELNNKPSIPKFKHKESSETLFKKYCEIGWKEKIANKIPIEKHPIYHKRIDEEIQTFKDANLFDYFLIVKDIIDYAKSKQYLVGMGRGSVGGALTGFLLGIHQLDSIQYNLLFSRFFNSGRKDSLPDIDTDVENEARPDIIKYIIKKYGKDNVMHIATYGSLMGRAALKAVFRAHGDIGFAEQNEITKYIVDKAKISDELQEMVLNGLEPSVIRWSLLNKSKQLSRWCSIKEDGQLTGPMSNYFEQAIRLEGVLVNLSIHAAGIVITDKPINTLFPVIITKDKEQVIGCQFQDLEYAGGMKLDLLGLSTLSKLRDINDI